MYRLSTPLERVKGIGEALNAKFTEYGIKNVKDLLLHTPLRYEDRSARTQIADLKPGELVTLTGKIVKPRNFYRGRRSIQSATLVDESGKVKLMWFNNPHVIDRFTVAADFLVSGKLGDRGTIVQPTVESFKQDGDTIHTGRLVPVYSAIPDIPAGTLRKILKEVVDHLTIDEDSLANSGVDLSHFSSLEESLRQLHFPESETKITTSRERLALEELVQLILHSLALKEQWRSLNKAVAVPLPPKNLTTGLPFELTGAQQRSLGEILADMNKTVPMNRLLLGDVGSGKTAVAGLASREVLKQNLHACLVTPTQILAEQHAKSLQQLFPELKIELMTAQTAKKVVISNTPTLFIGTHAILSRLSDIEPGLLIYDEQHRFGVQQRSATFPLKRQPHLLTLTATPIPRTLLLTIFSHLSLSVIDELPPGRKPVKSWLVPNKKRAEAYHWIAKELHQHKPAQALVICPFIDTSKAAAFENVAAAKTLYDELRKLYAKPKQKDQKVTLALLHGRMSKKEQQAVTTELFAQQIDILVTTPIVEVGLDLPAADIIVIEAAERFGLASLHQLRGRVGRAGQQAYCLLFTPSTAENVTERLTKFCETTNGLELAEQDLQRRGAGDIFGTQQHGLDQLVFANWTNLELVTQAKRLADHLIQTKQSWQSPLTELFSAHRNDEQIPLAN
ncbi:ATP-dependent DNA helicase RecG [Patescibacteria group bacterium]|nr:ATP-dependent DNA helicase RecG [Patescibacteria group bacterium]